MNFEWRILNSQRGYDKIAFISWRWFFIFKEHEYELLEGTSFISREQFTYNMLKNTNINIKSNKFLYNQTTILAIETVFKKILKNPDKFITNYVIECWKADCIESVMFDISLANTLVQNFLDEQKENPIIEFICVY